MDRDELIGHIKRLIAKTMNVDAITGTHAEISEFLRTYAGPKSSFLLAVLQYDPRSYSHDSAAEYTRDILQAYADYLETGLGSSVSPERQAQLDVVSDFLGMAEVLLENKAVHPAAPAVLIGATLEEFLRTWCEADGLPLGNRKPGMESYSQLLRDADLLTKQDGKDITAWAGVRNHAAHGEWEEVADKSRVRLMLEGVNLFMRKYAP
jgi:hypothetical protein